MTAVRLSLRGLSLIDPFPPGLPFSDGVMEYLMRTFVCTNQPFRYDTSDVFSQDSDGDGSISSEEVCRCSLSCASKLILYVQFADLWNFVIVRAQYHTLP